MSAYLYRYLWCGKRRSENELYREHNMFWNLSRVKAGLYIIEECWSAAQGVGCVHEIYV